MRKYLQIIMLLPLHFLYASMLFTNEEVFIGDEISQYNFIYYGDKTFWGQTFVKDLKQCNDKTMYMTFSPAKDRILTLKVNEKSKEHFYKIIGIKRYFRDKTTKELYLVLMELSKYKQDSDLEYYKSVGIDWSKYDRYQGIFIRENGSLLTVFNEELFDDGDTILFELYPCPVK